MLTKTKQLKFKKMENKKYYIKFLNKDKNFTEDIKYFKTWNQAKKWAVTDNFEKFHPDMIGMSII